MSRQSQVRARALLLWISLSLNIVVLALALLTDLPWLGAVSIMASLALVALARRSVLKHKQAISRTSGPGRSVLN